MSNLKPEDLRAVAERAQARASEVARLRALADAKAYEDAVEAEACEIVGRIMGSAAERLEAAAKSGSLCHTFVLTRTDQYADPEHKDAARRALKVLIECFKADGFKAVDASDHHITYEGAMDPSPVPDGTTWQVQVSW